MWVVGACAHIHTQTHAPCTRAQRRPRQHTPGRSAAALPLAPPIARRRCRRARQVPVQELVQVLAAHRPIPRVGQHSAAGAGDAGDRHLRKQREYGGRSMGDRAGCLHHLSGCPYLSFSKTYRHTLPPPPPYTHVHPHSHTQTCVPECPTSTKATTRSASSRFRFSSA